MMTQTINLLDECNAGCKMAMNSMSQVMEYVRDEDLANVIDDYTVKHQNMEKRKRSQG